MTQHTQPAQPAREAAIQEARRLLIGAGITGSVNLGTKIADQAIKTRRPVVISDGTVGTIAHGEFLPAFPATGHHLAGRSVIISSTAFHHAVLDAAREQSAPARKPAARSGFLGLASMMLASISS